MKKIIKLILFILIFSNFGTSFSDEKININKESISNQITNNNKKEKIKVEDIFIFYSKFFEQEIPESFKYIKLNFKGIKEGTEIEKALKILVYKDKLPNVNLDFSKIKNKDLNKENFYKLSYKIIGAGYSEKTLELIGDEKVDFYDLDLIEQGYKAIKNKEKFEKNLNLNGNSKLIFEDVYNIITTEHFDKNIFKEEDLYYSAIQGLTKATGDKHTTFFPPTESKDFLSGLSGDLEGIGTFVDMPKPGIFEITSPITGGPAEKAGIKGGDIIISVDGKKITEKNSQTEIISWIKGKAGTEVNLEIKRGEQILNFKLKREKVHIKSIETKISGNNFIIKITGFNENVSAEFREAVQELKGKIGIKKVIFDLRNNGGGYLDEVVAILNGIVPKGENIATVKYLDNEGKYISRGLQFFNINDYEIIFLQNSGTASASEIMIGTIKDYFPKVKIFGEKSYGKGSVQNIREFGDGSSIKYTTAKWFTGKTKTGIDGNGIIPDKEIIFDEEKYKRQKIDNQMKKALEI